MTAIYTNTITSASAQDGNKVMENFRDFERHINGNVGQYTGDRVSFVTPNIKAITGGAGTYAKIPGVTGWLISWGISTNTAAAFVAGDIHLFLDEVDMATITVSAVGELYSESLDFPITAGAIISFRTIAGGTLAGSDFMLNLMMMGEIST
jgi:hypothetical protein